MSSTSTLPEPFVGDVTTAEDLERLVASFPPFKSQMHAETQARLLKDKQAVEEKKRQTDRLRDLLHAHVHTRRMMNEQLQRYCDDALLRSRLDFESRVLANTQTVEERLEALNDRITELDAHFEREKQRIAEEVAERERELRAMLIEFEELFEAEVVDRKQREARITNELERHEKKVAAQFDVERETRTQVIERLIVDNHAAIKSRRAQDARLEEFAHRELAAVDERLRDTSAVRENEDDEIEAALSRYTEQLQTSLHIINAKE